MKELIEKWMNLILVGLVAVAAIAIAIPLTIRGCSTSTSNSEIVTVPETVAADATPDEVTEPSTQSSGIVDATVKITPKKALKSSTTSASEKTDPEETESEESTAESSTAKMVYATAEPVKNPASHEAQWNKGYVVAIDKPDKSYSCGHIELTDENRELVEKICMGEFESGGFTGAALVAQAVKNAMYFDGFTDVQDIITNYHYSGKLDSSPTQKVKDAVVYIFDMDMDAVQHKILYMYNPAQMKNKFSAYHESRQYVCTFDNVRFFDR